MFFNNHGCLITKYSSALYVGMAKVFLIIDVLGYDMGTIVHVFLIQIQHP